MTYELFVALLWLRPVSDNRLAYLVASGVSIGNSNEPADMAMFDSVSETREKAEDLSYKVNADRAVEDMRSKRGR